MKKIIISTWSIKYIFYCIQNNLNIKNITSIVCEGVNELAMSLLMTNLVSRGERAITYIILWEGCVA